MDLPLSGTEWMGISSGSGQNAINSNFNYPRALYWMSGRDMAWDVAKCAFCIPHTLRRSSWLFFHHSVSIWPFGLLLESWVAVRLVDEQFSKIRRFKNALAHKMLKYCEILWIFSDPKHLQVDQALMLMKRSHRPHFPLFFWWLDLRDWRKWLQQFNGCSYFWCCNPNQNHQRKENTQS